MAESTPRTFATAKELQDGLITMLFVLGEGGRDTIRRHLLKNADQPEMASLLKVMNDFERVVEWRAQQPPDARVP